MDWAALCFALGITLFVAILGNIFIGKDHLNWFKSLQKPRILVPMFIFYIVGPLFYLICGTILYRTLEGGLAEKQSLSVFILTIAVLVLNEVWNIFFFGLKSSYYGFIGVVVYLFPCLYLTAMLYNFDFTSMLIFSAYLLWLIYDIVWTYQLWKLNK